MNRYNRLLYMYKYIGFYLYYNKIFTFNLSQLLIHFNVFNQIVIS